MGCCSCKYLCENNRKEGKCSGAIYYCSKLKKYVNGYSNACNEYCKDYGKSTLTRNEIYNDGKNYYDDDTDPMVYLIILIFMIILAVIVNV